MAYNRWLCHHGVKGMKWGVRKSKMTYGDYYYVKSNLSQKERDQYEGYSFSNTWYQSKEGKRDERRSTKVYSNLAKKYKKQGNKNQWHEPSDRFATSLRDKHGNAMGFIIGQDRKRYINVAIAITKEHRGTYVSKKLVDEGKSWLDKHPEYTELRWYAVADNKASQKLAEKSGFKRAKQYDASGDVAYVYKRKDSSGGT